MPKVKTKDDVKKPETRAEYKEIVKYYMQDMTIKRTAEHFKCSEAKVQDAIKYCKSAGMFEIPPDDELLKNIILDKLKRRQLFRKDYEHIPLKSLGSIEHWLSKIEADILMLRGLYVEKREDTIKFPELIKWLEKLPPKALDEVEKNAEEVEKLFKK